MNTLTHNLTTSNRGNTSTDDAGFAVFISDVAITISDFITITISFTVVTTCCHTKSKTTLAIWNGNTCVPTFWFVFTALLVYLLSRFNVDFIIGIEVGTTFTCQIWTNDVDIRIFTRTSGNNINLISSVDLTGWS